MSSPAPTTPSLLNFNYNFLRREAWDTFCDRTRDQLFETKPLRLPIEFHRPSWVTWSTTMMLKRHP